MSNLFIMRIKSKGFTVIELILVVSILGIISTIAVPRFLKYGDLAVERVCTSNRNTIERMYSVYLLDNHSVNNFDKYLIENFNNTICPADGIIRYEYGIVYCSVHLGPSEEGEAEQPPGEEVPWL